ncbi:TonB-dependent receptor plug [Fibrella aestuarina BUZ 2]|uniref:TonB-dependent receptor plug n=2 Tax=Fibrella TaxID=861914 RepID=I0K6C7_9BACT|nr:TonB-dependent receptor plug [Fibrella aestuarina BUZ 2]
MQLLSKSYRLPYLVMRRTVYQLLIALVFVGISKAYDAHAQELLNRKVTLQLTNLPIKTVLSQLSKQTNVRFTYSSALIRGERKVSINVSNQPLGNVLNELLVPLKIEYRVDADEVVLNPAPTGSATESRSPVNQTNDDKLGTKPADITVTGTVVDEKGEKLPGVSIVIKGTTRGTNTLGDGTFSINVPDADAVLIFSFVGYVPQELTVGNRTALNIALKLDDKSLDEVVVIGYGTAKKRDITGAVARADLNAFKEAPNVSLLQSLQGSVPGLNVGATTQAGQDPTISIRGRNSISGSTAPLIVLDGIIYRGSIVDINPNDIASVDILKDASAAAVYGSQAANGVILITSKTGKGTKKPTVEYSGSYSLQEITNKAMLPDNAAGFLQKKADRYISLSRTGSGLTQENPTWDVTKFVSPQVLAGIQNGTDTNWWELLTNRRPFIMNHDLSISGRTEQSSYFFSLGYTKQQNVVKNDDYQRYNFRVNLDSKVTNWMKVGLQSFYGLSDYSGAAPSLDDVQYEVPQLSPYDATGALLRMPDNARVNPLLQIGQQNLEKRSTLFGLLFADISIPFVKGLSYRLNFSQNLIDGKTYNFSSFAQNFNGEAAKLNSSQYLATLDNIVTYQNSFGPHAVNATLLYGTERRTFESTNAYAAFFTNDVLGYNKLDAGQAGLQSTTSNAWKEASLYSMARLIYSFRDKYVVTGTVRRDGFSGFSETNKFGVFPSLAMAWALSEEGFLKDKISVLNELKLRASYGVSGNRTLGRYQTLAKMTANVGNGYLYGDGGAAQQGQFLSALANSDLKWESTQAANFGLDFALFKNRLSGSFNTYISNTYNLLFNVDLPVANGLTSTPANIGKLRNTGQELTLSGRPIERPDFTWDMTVNFARNRNKVVSILGIDANKDGVEDDLVSSKIFINQPYGVAYDFNIIGMWQVADAEANRIPAGFTYGTYKVEDLNGDGAYTAAADRKILGYTDPSYRFSIQNSFRYKAWEFSFFINSIQGGSKYYYGQPGNALPNPDNISNGNIFKFDYWTPEKPNARYRQIGYYTVALGETFSPYVQRNFVRLQNVTLSYNLPQTLTQRMKLNRVKLFLNGKNLVTLTDWDGWDPETGTGLDRSAYPLLRNYTAGLNIEF